MTRAAALSKSDRRAGPPLLHAERGSGRAPETDTVPNVVFLVPVLAWPDLSLPTRTYTGPRVVALSRFPFSPPPLSARRMQGSRTWPGLR